MSDADKGMVARRIHPDVQAAIDAQMTLGLRAVLVRLLQPVATEHHKSVLSAFHQGCRDIAQRAREDVANGRDPQMVAELHAATHLLEELLTGTPSEPKPL